MSYRSGLGEQWAPVKMGDEEVGIQHGVVTQATIDYWNSQVGPDYRYALGPTPTSKPFLIYSGPRTDIVYGDNGSGAIVVRPEQAAAPVPAVAPAAATAAPVAYATGYWSEAEPLGAASAWATISARMNTPIVPGVNNWLLLAAAAAAVWWMRR